MTASTILALDISTRCGWAFDRLAYPGQPESGLWRCPGSLGSREEGYDYGQSFAFLERKLRAFIEDRRPGMIVKESPLKLLHPKKGFGHDGKMQASLVTSQATIRCLVGLDAIVEKVAHQCGVPAYDVNVQEVKAYFVRGGATKEEMVRRCELLGWDCHGDHNEADAMAIWSLGKARIDPKFSPMTTPLFGRKEARP